jgi:hypothetical protein
MYACILNHKTIVKRVSAKFGDTATVKKGGRKNAGEPTMRIQQQTVGIRCRVWIVQYEGAPPIAWHDIPVEAVAIEPAEGQTMSARQAARYVEAFNRAAVTGPQKVWAVALPVTIHYEGDAKPGERVPPPSAHKKSPLLACQVSACNGLPPRDLT